MQFFIITYKIYMNGKEQYSGQIAVTDSAETNGKNLWKDLVVNAFGRSLLEGIFVKFEVSQKTEIMGSFYTDFCGPIDDKMN